MAHRTTSCVLCEEMLEVCSGQLEQEYYYLREFRAVRANVDVDTTKFRAFLTGVGSIEYRYGHFSAPSDSTQRYDDPDYRPTNDDEFLPQGPQTSPPGFVVHDACWKVLQGLVYPHEIPLGRFYAICSSFIYHSVGALSLYYPLFTPSRRLDISYRSRRRNPANIPELQSILREAEVLEYLPEHGKAAVVSGVFRSKEDTFVILPVELREEILCLLKSDDVVNIRLASRSFASIKLPQKFWRSRFSAGFEKHHIFEPRMREGGGSRRYDWKLLYDRTNKLGPGVFGLRFRKGIWEMNEPLASLLTSQIEKGDVYSDEMKEHNHIIWRTAEYRDQTKTYPPSFGKEPFHKNYAMRLPGALTQISILIISFRGLQYVSGIRIYPKNQEAIMIGYAHGGHRVILDIPCDESGSLLPITGFKLGIDGLGIRGIQVLAGDHISQWAGDHENVSLTQLLCMDEPITHFKARFDGFRMYSLSVPEEKQITTENPPLIPIQKAALWFPFIPAGDKLFHDLNRIDRNSQNPWEPLRPAMFGGEHGEYLQHLTRISVTMAGRFLCTISFHYDNSNAPVKRTAIYSRTRHYMPVDTLAEPTGTITKKSCNIDGPGGERVVNMRLKDDEFCEGRDGRALSVVSALEILTNRGRSLMFGANSLPQISMPLTPPVPRPRKKKFQLLPGHTITGIYGRVYASHLVGLGVISEQLG
ncbi:hypothetical protein FQN57_005300 [Myotisia sp. PD_48]|nr:hypothetical protein FQN57_005300 [Myotisia sp. PD_48]